MSNLKLSLAMGNYDRTRAIVDGRVQMKRLGVDVMEVFSPPRLTVVAQERGLKAGAALDLTVLDEDGNGI